MSFPSSSRYSSSFAFFNTLASDDLTQNIDKVDPPTAFVMALAQGTGVGQFDRAFHDLRTLTNASFIYTLSALAGGQAMAHARQLYLVVRSPVGTTGTITIAPGSSNGWTNGIPGIIPMTPGGQLSLCWPDGAGPVVAAGSNDQVTIAVTGTLQYFFALLGTST